MDIDRFRDYVVQQKPVQFVLETYYQKPLKDLSLKEILDGMVANCKVSNTVDMIEYSDDGDYYTYKITHDLGINNSKILQIVNESVLTTYGVKTDYIVSDRSLFMKIYKNA